ncbi:MAG TPA: CusA/CzcA family heavy metal efflux RND transporter [Polyangiaceae bacterium LLY-WYZ-15_(1-7)]|nr:CusA/CzcA family heavy metal efflux RND transporter [Sandaracinus sp.]HJL00801.1 CusA/CzcA family heavy metal efflux RND transporter [Polyangiaceae bacterium LLY-WYZ-15_(1-7)]MBJ70824.1 CusA/CzcA family heavy metal efflux RND transporter [Sandaracinus sp.]HJL13551.1 CusA/CzcA family heavy metal efflux RND transporter [Polyangiaceae bacterium LLY-WYZ-15_(1-7)]HJL22991.1 CusA/CzcA family heavy metal efflux RND transporter [Polyangiaceae bacterium LLY-WYZ-15_(1-7)]
MIARLLTLAIERRRLVLAFVAAAAAAAFWQARHLRLDALPDVTGNQVVILTRAPGYTPEEVERLVTRPVELALGGVPGLDTQRSISRYGLSSVTAVFEEDVDLLRARQLVQERLGTLDQLPNGVAPPELGPLTGGLGEILQFTVRSPERTPAELLELVDLRVAPILRAAPGVVEVNSWGGHRRTLDVIGDPVAMAAHDVDLEMLRQAVARASGNAPGDALEAGAGRVLVRARAWPDDAADLGAGIVHQEEHGGLVRIADVATVREGAAPRLGAATADGRGETVYVMVQMLREANALEVLDGLEARMPAVDEALPDDVTLDVIYDRGELVGATLKTVAKNLAEGGLLVVVVLFLMLGSARAGLIVAATIPLAMLGALVGMVLLDVPGNLMSLGAIDFGLLVDGAVVLVEAVFHRLEEEDGPAVPTVRAAVVSMARPVFFSVAIIVLVYVPILTLTGVDGKLFQPMALTVVLALVTALALTLTFVPAAAAQWLRRRHVPKKTPFLVRGAARLHAPALAFAARHPIGVAGGALGALLVGAFLFWRAGTAFVPQLDEGDLVIQTTRAADVSLETAVEEAGRLERAVLATPEVRTIASRIGSPAVATDVMGLEQADVFVRLAPRAEWRPGLTREALIDELATRIEAEAPGSDPAFTQPIQMRFNELLGGEVSDVSLSFFGEDLDALRAAAEEAQRALGDLPGAEDVRITSPPAVPLHDVRPDPIRAARHGLDPTEVMDGVRALRIGLEAGATWDGLLRVPLRVRLPEPSAFDLEEAAIPTDHGPVPLSAVAAVSAEATPSMISHDDAQRRVVLGFNVRGRDLGTVVVEAQRRVRDLALPPGTRVEWGGQWETLQAAQARLAVVLPVVLAGILALLLILFRSWRPALIILLHVPFAALGGIALLTLRGMPVSISAAVGFIALSGIAVLNGVVLVARIRDQQEAGVPARQAALEAARSRLRPVLTTALVAALGFVPMMLATGVGAEVQRPLATVVVGGLLTSTLLTLLVLPVVYPVLAGRSGPPPSP